MGCIPVHWLALHCRYYRSVFNGIVVNTQVMYGINTYSGGLPFTWFEFYYSPSSTLTVGYVINSIGRHNFKIDLFVFIVNVMIITAIGGKIIALFIFVKKKLKKLPD